MSFLPIKSPQIELWNNSENMKKKYMSSKHLDEKLLDFILEKLGQTHNYLGPADYISVKTEGPYKPDAYR